jgi:hypothetical protein
MLAFTSALPLRAATGWLEAAITDEKRRRKHGSPESTPEYKTIFVFSWPSCCYSAATRLTATGGDRRR